LKAAYSVCSCQPEKLICKTASGRVFRKYSRKCRCCPFRAAYILPSWPMWIYSSCWHRTMGLNQGSAWTNTIRPLDAPHVGNVFRGDVFRIVHFILNLEQSTISTQWPRMRGGGLVGLPTLVIQRTPHLGNEHSMAAGRILFKVLLY